MLGLQHKVVDAVFQAVAGHLPARVADHPLGCHRPRTSDRKCFFGILVRLVTGCSWDVAGRITDTSESTLRRRRDEWVYGITEMRNLRPLHIYTGDWTPP